MWSKISTTVDFKLLSTQHSFLSLEAPTNTSASARLRIPISIMGNGEGPTLFVAAGMHGDEYEGQVACHELIKLLSSELITGRLIIMPSVNMPACLESLRFSPVDGKNMLNCFSNNPNGTVSEIIGHYLENYVFPNVDIMLDLHSGGRSLLFHPIAMAFHAKGETGISEESQRILNVLDFDYAEIRTYNGNNPDYILNACKRTNVTYLATELGGGESIDCNGVDLAIRNVHRLLDELHMLKSGMAIVKKQPFIMKMDRKTGRIFADVSGIFQSLILPGEAVKVGQNIGRIINLHSQEHATISATVTGTALAVRAIPLTQVGDCLFEIATTP